ncbi:methyltransferase domain-containing protein [Pseudonocardia sp. DSM 110487]|uniref:class I SAM-dependent methyltransferase n=1 Tax=Pseudonocardia sp. DSM 110487 TaxID=2865833 RepID=UPI001C69AC00|nr:methyltransferase domain-containing protein [Pseudonocardia sp. DSM 110487]QYN38902.1 methyltransferase domain-containing protein [Pseudonocardia sp. DSM 110487]
MPGTGSVAPAYSNEAPLYDSRTRGFDTYRRRIVEWLPLQQGDVVLDVGCGTGLCFPFLLERVGPAGAVVGVDASPEMLALAAERASARGWRNVELVESAIEDAELPTVDHALFCAVHDIIQSAAALDHVLAHVRRGVAAGGGKWAPPWAFAVNAGVLALHTPYVRDFAGFDRPWTLLAERVPDLVVNEVAMGGGWDAGGSVYPRVE